VEQSSVLPENIDELTAEYQRLWPLVPVLHANIGKLAGKDAFKACAKRLGMLNKQGGKIGIHFEHEVEMDVFQDYLIYMYRPRGFSLVRQMLNRNRYPQGSDERMLLESMVQARFSLFWIRELHPASGFVALDVITGEDFFVLDQSIPHQGEVGLLIALRLYPFRNAWMHTGSSLILGLIDDVADLHPLGCRFNEKEERELNEKIVHRRREIIREQEA
jgi:hypothetical protein